MARNPKAEIKAIHDLTRSKGWAVIQEIMEREIVSAAMAIAENPAMTLDEINFRRGAIWAGKQMLEIPERLIRKIEADIALSGHGTTRPDPED